MSKLEMEGKKHMKKNVMRILALLTVLVLTFAGLNCFAEDGNYLEPASLNSAKKSANEWVSSSANRQQFVVSMILDSVGMWSDYDSDVFSYAAAAETIYIGIHEDVVSVFAFGQSDYFNFLYVPAGGRALFGTEPLTGASAMADSAMRNLQNDDLLDQYWKIDSASVFKVLETMVG